MTIVTTNPAVPSWPMIGVSHVNPEKLVACAEVTTTGRETVPLGGSDRPRSVVMSSMVSCSFSTELPLPAPRTSAIFARILAR